MEENKYIEGVYVDDIYLHKLKLRIPYIIRGKVKGETLACLNLITKTKKEDLKRYDSEKIKAKLGLKENHSFEIVRCETIITNESYKRDSETKRAN